MHTENASWRDWYMLFAARNSRPLPTLQADSCYRELPSSLARSLAVFQLGESGGGTVIEQARQGPADGINSHYADAMELFVEEEHRHANMLAMCVSMLGGKLIRKNWTAKLFVRARRLMGLRLKVLVLLAAEVVGLCYYDLIASKLPPCQIKSILSELVHDERAHLQFHCTFLREQTNGTWRCRVFVAAWRVTMFAAALVVLMDHRELLRDFEISHRTVWRQWWSYALQAERGVEGKPDLSAGRPRIFQLHECLDDAPQ